MDEATRLQGLLVESQNVVAKHLAAATNDKAGDHPS